MATGTKTRIKIHICAFTAALIAARTVCATDSRPEPRALLDAALAGSNTAYEGRVMVIHWYGKKTHADEMRVFFYPPNLHRREFLAPDGSVTRISVSDGEREQIQLLRQGKVLEGDAVKSYDKLIPPEKELELLQSNYKLSVEGPDQEAGRAVWILLLTPLTPGKPCQKLWIDMKTHAILSNKRYLPKRPFADLSRFTKFEVKKEFDNSLFTFKATSGAAAGSGLEPDFMTIADLEKATGRKTDFPAELPEGFTFESADYFNVNHHLVSHARYTDGLAVISLFETDRPVRLPKNGTLDPAPIPGGLRASSAGKILQWRRHGHHFTLVGDLSRELLIILSSRLR